MSGWFITICATAWLFASLGTTLIVTRSVLFGGFRAWASGAESVPADYDTSNPPPHGYVAQNLLWPDPPRKLGVLVHCPMCLGFWSGVFWALVVAMPIYELVPIPTHLLQLSPFALLAAGSAAAWFSWTAHLVQVALGEDDLLGRR